ncbi:MAG TPA: hypothetical protein VJ851_07085 [Jatrophihabitans sp.]|nr:hypothetical protein [Jatrophihabitans sp.]
MAGVVTGPEPGPLADEAARLVGAAQEWLHRVVGESDGPRIATGAPECCWCPVCQLIATLRGDRPELVERLAEAQTALAGVLRALADAARPAGREPTAEQTVAEPAAGSSAEQTAGSKPKTGRGRVQRIPLDEDRAEPPRRG